MNPDFLKKLIEKQLMSSQDHPKGIAISNLPSEILKNNTNTNKNQHDRKILIIPSGMGETSMNHFKTMSGVTIADGIDKTYMSNDSSFKKFVNTIETIKPTLIVAGSRGAELVARLLEELYMKNTRVKYKGKILLFGAVHLTRVFDANKKNALILVHGAHDKNEKIESVRGLVANHKKNATLIEAKNKGHDMNFEDKSTLLNVIRYVYSI